MLKPNSISTNTSNKVHTFHHRDLEEYSTLELAQALAARLAIPERDWHKLKSNRQVRALELTIAALVFMIKGKTTEAITRLQQATKWLNQSISAPPCPSHGSHKK
ncbi:hypothetical protein Tery_2244 [Trichodesmium erythraeum IMS101]|uniref:Uncharacterized protein n=1 Tax=Trichodesmium erythraeum (strain IMS101) TaxID=203124 RepID=Q112V1_TRIEI|nr:DUF6439 family protein [Trichodesmium sp. St11_bin5]